MLAAVRVCVRPLGLRDWVLEGDSGVGCWFHLVLISSGQKLELSLSRASTFRSQHGQALQVSYIVLNFQYSYLDTGHIIWSELHLMQALVGWNRASALYRCGMPFLAAHPVVFSLSLLAELSVACLLCLPLRQVEVVLCTRHALADITCRSPCSPPGLPSTFPHPKKTSENCKVRPRLSMSVLNRLSVAFTHTVLWHPLCPHTHSTSHPLMTIALFPLWQFLPISNT